MRTFIFLAAGSILAGGAAIAVRPAIKSPSPPSAEPVAVLAQNPSPAIETAKRGPALQPFQGVAPLYLIVGNDLNGVQFGGFSVPLQQTASTKWEGAFVFRQGSVGSNLGLLPAGNGLGPLFAVYVVAISRDSATSRSGWQLSTAIQGRVSPVTVPNGGYAGVAPGFVDRTDWQGQLDIPNDTPLGFSGTITMPGGVNRDVPAYWWGAPTALPVSVSLSP